MKAKLLLLLTLLSSFLTAPSVVLSQSDKPNILVIFGDDIGIANVSAYSDGLMSYTTPNMAQTQHLNHEPQTA